MIYNQCVTWLYNEVVYQERKAEYYGKTFYKDKRS